MSENEWQSRDVGAAAVKREHINKSIGFADQYTGP